MPEFNRLYPRSDRPQCRLGLSKGGIQASLGYIPDYLEVEYLQGRIRLTEADELGPRR